MSSQCINTHIATDTEVDVNAVLSITNDAFMADAFFKKQEYHLRFDLDNVRSMINEENSRFIIATQSVDGEEVPCGSIFFHWTISSTNDTLQVSKCLW